MLHTVNVYDSFYSTPSHSLTVQVSAILRGDGNTEDEENVDDIQFLYGTFQKQPPNCRMCGYYAVAAAVSCILLEDPNCMIYDETLLRSHFQQICNSRQVLHFPSCSLKPSDNATVNVVVHTVQKFHCICQRPSAYSSFMIRCDNCNFWFHRNTCVFVDSTPRTLERCSWFCPCCTTRVRKRQATNTVA